MNKIDYEGILEKEYEHINKIIYDINALEEFLLIEYQNIEFNGVNPDKFKEAIALIDTTSEYRDTYKNHLSIISNILGQIDKTSDITEEHYLRLSTIEDTLTKSFKSVEKTLMDYYRTSNISKISCVQTSNQVFTISVKVKMMPDELLLPLVNQDKYISFNITELTEPNEDYRFMIFTNCLTKALSERAALLEGLVVSIQDALINSDPYRPFAYEHLKDMLLADLYPPTLPVLYELNNTNTNGRAWQKDALDQFLGVSDKDAEMKNKYHMICEAGTGTGKTRFSLMCVAEILKKNPSTKIRIIVPKIILMLQWAKELKKILNVSPDKIRLMGGSMCSSKVKDNCNLDFSIYVINTARNSLVPDMLNSINEKNTSNFIITDECHHYYSEKNIQIFQGVHKYNRNPDIGVGYYSLALSATPYSWNYVESDLLKKFNLFTSENVTREHMMYELLGPGKYTYSLVHAIADGVVAPLKIINLDCRLTIEEQKQYDLLKKKLLISIARFESELITYYSTGNDIPDKYDDDEALIRLAINITRGEQKIVKEIQKQKPKGTILRNQTFVIIENWLKFKDPFYKVVYAASIVNGINIKIEDLINNCESRKRKCIDLGNVHQNDKVILFSESIKSTDFIHKNLCDLIGEEKLLKYHSKMILRKIMKWRIINEKIPKEDLMDSYLEPFKNGSVNVLCTARVFDEGIDIPNANIGIIFQGTQNERQNIQRVGRIIRKRNVDDTKIATIYWFYNSECRQQPFLNGYFTKIEKDIIEAESSGLPLPESIRKSKRGLELINEFFEVIVSIDSEEPTLPVLGN